MKRLNNCAWLLLLVLTAQRTGAQTWDDHGSPKPGMFEYSFERGTFSSNVPLNEIRPKAFRYFLRNYPGASNAHWVSEAQGISVVFSDSVFSTRVLFDGKGNFVSSDRAYSENGLAPDLKGQLNRLFPGYSVMTVVEDFDGGQTLYFVVLSGTYKIKSIEIKDGHVLTVDEFYNGSGTKLIRSGTGFALPNSMPVTDGGLHTR